MHRDSILTIRAKDASNRPAETQTKTVFIDTVAPELSITNPAAFTNSEYVTFNGNVTEANLSTLVVKLYKQGSTTELDTANITPQGSGETKTWSYTAHLSDNNESYYITATATDLVNSQDEKQSSAILLDRTVPVSHFLQAD